MDENFFKFNFIINKFYKWNCKIYSGQLSCFINGVIKFIFWMIVRVL